jgi:hypothetical protein
MAHLSLLTLMFCDRTNVVLLGPESSGKSKIFEQLSSFWDSNRFDVEQQLSEGLNVRSFQFEYEEGKGLRLPTQSHYHTSKGRRNRTPGEVTPPLSPAHRPSLTDSDLISKTIQASLPKLGDRLSTKRPRARIDLWDFCGNQVFVLIFHSISALET